MIKVQQTPNNSGNIRRVKYAPQHQQRHPRRVQSNQLSPRNTEAIAEYMDTPGSLEHQSVSRCGQEKHQGTLSVTPQVILRIAWATYGVEVIRHCLVVATSCEHENQC